MRPEATHDTLIKDKLFVYDDEIYYDTIQYSSTVLALPCHFLAGPALRNCIMCRHFDYYII